MMISEMLHKKMVDSGLWDKEATAVLEQIKIKDTPTCKMLAPILNKEWEAYPIQFRAVAWLATKKAVIKYMDDNAPEHFARSMFT